MSPALTWSVMQNVDIDLVGQFVFQKTGDDFVSLVQAAFLRVKWSY